MSVGLEIPKPELTRKIRQFMLSHLVILPSVHIQPRIHGAVCIAPIARDGEFNHDSFSRLYLDEDKANFQLHLGIPDCRGTSGYVVSESLEGLEHFQDLEGTAANSVRKAMPRLPVFQMSQSVGVQNCCCSSINDFANGTTVAEWSIRRWL